MKKKCLLLVGMLALSLAFTGCGKDKKEPVPVVAVTATPVPTVTPTPVVEEEEPLVQMQKTEKEKNAIGNKTATASKAVITNKTGTDIAEIYIRPNTADMDDYEWGSELLKEAFTLKTGEQAIYYFDSAAKDASGKPITLYDIRINYANSSHSEYYFRKLPLNTIQEISLCMDNSDYGTIPYAKYQTKGNTMEFSTLEEVKQRIGYYDIEIEEEYTEPEEIVEPEPSEEEQQIDQAIGSAESCIGSSVDVLFGTVGEPDGSDYVVEPESGETGYHYYDSFTVYTTVDENGNEIVAGVW